MAEYIEREALKEEILHGKNKPTIYDGAQEVEWIEECIKNAPTANVQEVRHARWEYFFDIEEMARCSNCYEVLKKGQASCYCSHCGAKMGEE